MNRPLQPKPPRIGDRVVQAIEDHVDVEHELERAETEQPARGKLVRTAIWLTITGISLYLVAPSLLDVLGSYRDVGRFQLKWLAAMALAQGLSLACIWFLQRLAMRPVAIGPVITSQLAGNALGKIAPGGGAIGAALQYKMLVQAGVARERAVGGLTVVNLLTFTMVLALPVLAIPTLLRGGVERNLVEVAAVGLVVFVALAALAVVAMTADRPLAWVGGLVQRVRNRLLGSRAPLAGLPERLLRERDRILATLGPRWKRALLATWGRWIFDFFTLLAALAAVDASPRPGLVLLAFCAAQVLAQIPLTPGGLGFVEAGLTGLLTLAGVNPGDAVLATFAYRLFSYWLPLPLGLVGALAHRRIIGSDPGPAGGPGGPGGPGRPSSPSP